MNGALGQWWRYPYGVAGPAVVTYLAATAIAGAVSALALKGLLWQLGPGFVVLSLGERVAQMASRRYARKRHIARPPRPGQMRQAVERWSGIWLAYIAGVIPIVVGWHYGWSWTLIAGALLAYQLPIRWRWAKRGYPGDPRWARDWSRETHPAYEFRGVSEFLRGHYDEAQRLF